MLKELLWSSSWPILQELMSNSNHQLLLSMATASNVRALVLLILLTLVLNKIKPKNLPRSLPGPSRYPGFGILFHLRRNWERLPTYLTEQCVVHNGKTWGGPVINLSVLGGSVFVINDAQNLQYIMKDNFENYEKGAKWRDAFDDILGNGIFNVDGDLWRLHRKVSSHMFTRNLMRCTNQVVLDKLKEVEQLLLTKLEQGVNTCGDGGSSMKIDIQDVFFRFMIDVAALITFGVELSSLDPENEKQTPFSTAFDEAQELCRRRYADPLYKIKKIFKVTRNERRLRQCVKTMDLFAKNVIESKRRRCIDEGHALGPDLLSRFIETAVSHGDPIPSHKELRDIVLNFMVAGRDTTACAISWAMYELTRNPQTIIKIIDEVHSVCGVGDDASYCLENISKLDYTHAVVFETLRLHPSVPVDGKYAVNQDTLPDKTAIPKGSFVVWSPMAYGRSTILWGDDALEFNPHRFLNGKEPSPYIFPSFNAGYRLCIGKPMAIMTIKMALAYLLPRFYINDVEGHSGEYRWTLVKAMKNGFPVRVSKRNT